MRLRMSSSADMIGSSLAGLWRTGNVAGDPVAGPGRTSSVSLWHAPPPQHSYSQKSGTQRRRALERCKEEERTRCLRVCPLSQRGYKARFVTSRRKWGGIAPGPRTRRPAQPPGGGGDALHRGGVSAIAEVLERVEAAAAAGVGVVISGETGTGKDLCAVALHRSSHRRRGPMVAVNCAAIPGELFEAEMFAHERGRSGLTRQRASQLQGGQERRPSLSGRGGGPEPGPPGQAAAGHRVRSVRAGGLHRDRGDGRVGVIAASNRDLARRVEEGRFRQDLSLPAQRHRDHHPPP